MALATYDADETLAAIEQGLATKDGDLEGGAPVKNIRGLRGRRPV